MVSISTINRKLIKLESERQETFRKQDEILEKFREINSPRFDDFSELSLEAHLLGKFGKVEGVKRPRSLVKQHRLQKRKRSRIVNQMSKLERQKRKMR